MLYCLLTLSLVLCGGAMHFMFRKRMMTRIGNLERDLQSFTDVMSKVAEVQTKTYEKFSGRFEELEERIMELSLPSEDTGLPLERRHQVLALANRGVGLKDIVKRLKAPVGEAELILSLQKLRGECVHRSVNGM